MAAARCGRHRFKAFFLLLDSPLEECSGVLIAENARRCGSPTLHLQENALVDDRPASVEPGLQDPDLPADLRRSQDNKIAPADNCRG